MYAYAHTVDHHRCTCGNVKSVRAMCCRDCYDLLRTVRADGTVHKPMYDYGVCPQCGGRKLSSSKLCWDCHMENTRKPIPACVVCGLTKRDRRGTMCKPCANRANGEHLNAINAERRRNGLRGSEFGR